MTQRWLRPSCVALLFAAWMLDLVTPQLFVVAILLDGPIALSSLALDSRFTLRLVWLALLANFSAGYINGVQDGYRWEGVAIADRAIAALSFLLVGSLSIATQRSAARAGELAARQDRAARERSVQRAVEAVRQSINPELVKRAIVREARASFEVDGAVFYAFEPSLDEPSTYASFDGSEVEAGTARPAAEILSLLHRISERHEGIVTLLDTDALDRLRLATFEARSAIAAPLVEYETTYGVLVLVRRDSAFDAYFEDAIAAFVSQAAIALAQAKLFAQLGERNGELAAANAALRERGDVIRDIVYALSHDLRTPLSAARMTMLQALDGAYGDLPPAYRAILASTIASNDELQRLAETLLLVSRYESGDRSVRRDPVDLAAVAASVVVELEPLWTSKHLDVRSDFDASVIVDGDDRELRRAIVNLLANAVNWTPNGRRIDVRVQASVRAVVAVEDEGYGVPENERAGLFERNVQRSRQGSGSGLGLYLVRRIAESHGGTVTYAPRAGGGSRFALELPLSYAAANAAPEYRA